MSPADGITAAVIGASGFTGAEVCRLLLGHPEVAAIRPVSRDADGLPFERVHPNLLGSGLSFVSRASLESDDDAPHVVFFCTPTGHAMTEAGAFLDRGSLVIDLSADFRFPDPEHFERAHQQVHTAPVLQRRAVYGVSELNRDRIRDARLIANPGCYAIAAILGLAPLASAGMLSGRHVAINAINGTTGAGGPGRALHHARAHGSVLPYNLDGHRHLLEIESQLSALGASVCDLDLSTMHGPFARGIAVVATVSCPDGSAPPCRDDIGHVFSGFYKHPSKEERFVHINTFPRAAESGKEYDIYPQVAHVLGSNACHIGTDVDRETGSIKVVGVIDNLGKGAAGSAVQNMNIAMGFEEHLGLPMFGL